MKITDSEKRIIIALKVLKPLFLMNGYVIHHLCYDDRDGDCFVFTNRKKKTFTIQLFPTFEILYDKKLTYYRHGTNKKPVDLIEEKNMYPDFSHLPDFYNLNSEDELYQILNAYATFIEKYFL